MPNSLSHAQFRRSVALARLGPGPFTTAQARAAGLTRDDLRSNAVTTVMRGVHLDAGVRVDHQVRCAAALLVSHPDAWVAGSSAARLLGLPVPDHDLIQVSVPPCVEMRRSDLAVRRRRGGAEPVWVPCAVIGGRLPVTPPVDLVGELATELPLVDAIVLADAVLARGRDVERTKQRWRDGSRRLRRIGDLSHAGAESPMETRLRVLLVLAGLSDVVVQHELTISGRVRRFDLAFPQERVAVEYDGAHHFPSEDQKHLDAVRREEAQAAGWIIVTVVPRGIFTDPAGTLTRVVRALQTRGRNVLLGEGWRHHFPQRTRR